MSSVSAKMEDASGDFEVLVNLIISFLFYFLILVIRKIRRCVVSPIIRASRLYFEVRVNLFRILFLILFLIPS